jgi:hypothetical protein
VIFHASRIGWRGKSTKGKDAGGRASFDVVAGRHRRAWEDAGELCEGFFVAGGVPEEGEKGARDEGGGGSTSWALGDRSAVHPDVLPISKTALWRGRGERRRKNGEEETVEAGRKTRL